MRTNGAISNTSSTVTVGRPSRQARAFVALIRWIAARELAPSHPTLGDVDSIEALEDYQAKKRAHKASMRAAKTS